MAAILEMVFSFFRHFKMGTLEKKRQKLLFLAGMIISLLRNVFGSFYDWITLNVIKLNIIKQI